MIKPTTPQSSLIIKVCGITRVEDGLLALEAGADWLGFVRWSMSPRSQPLEVCAKLIENLRLKATKHFDAVGVYVNATRDVIEREMVRLGLDRIQLHGDETLAFARSIQRPVIKAIRIRNAASIRAADNYEGLDLLADAFDAALPGGTGQGYDYALLRALVRKRRIIIAGGLNPAGVGKVIRDLQPWGVDVSTGVEVVPGVKDATKLREFIGAARSAAKEFCQ